MSKRQLFYFVQPEILLNTNRYKIGISQSLKYDRIKNYGAKVRTLLTLEDLENAKDFEKIIIKKFNRKFTSIGGNEYFEGSEYLMSNVIYQEYIKYKYNKDIQIKLLNYNDNEVVYISSDEEGDEDDIPKILHKNAIINIGKKIKKYKYNNYLSLYNFHHFTKNFKLYQHNKIYKKKQKKYLKKQLHTLIYYYIKNRLLNKINKKH